MKRVFKNSIINLWRNRFAGIATIVIIAILVFIFNVILVVHYTSQQEIKKLGQKIDLVVYLQDKIDDKKAEEMKNYIGKLEGVEKSTYISQQKALEQFLGAHKKTAEYYKKFNLENTLPASIRVGVKGPEYYEAIEEKIQKSPYKNLTANLAEDKKDLTITGNIIRNLEDLSKITRYLLYWVISAFILGTLLMVYNTINLNIYTRRMEISIMRLVGAGEKFIQLPYLLEGLWISLIALILSFSFFWTINETTLLNELQFFTKSVEIPYAKIFLLEALATIALNSISSFLAVQKHVRMKHTET